MEIAIIIVLGVLLLGFIGFRVGDYFSPWTLTVGIWFAIMFTMQFQGDLLYPLSEQFYISLSLWVPILSFSALITYLVMPKVSDEEKATTSEIHINDTAFNALFVISMIITPVYVYKIMSVISRFDMTDMLYNLRMLAVYGDENYGFLSYSYIINHVLLAIGLWKYPKIPTWQLLAIYFVNVLSFIAIMEKGVIFFMLSSTLFVFYEKKVIRLRSIVISIASVIVLFFVINTLRTPESVNEEDEHTFLEFFAVYILSPAVAYGKISVDISEQFGSQTFQVIYLLLNKLGGHFEVNQKLQEFVWVPLPTNVYTIFQFFFQDFGQKGVAFFALVYGVITGYTYRLARNGNSIAKAVYVYWVYMLILQFFQENLFANIVQVIQYILFAAICMQDKVSFTLKRTS